MRTQLQSSKLYVEKGYFAWLCYNVLQTERTYGAAVMAIVL